MALAPVHLVGSQPDHGVETQPINRRLHVGEKHPPHPRVALAENLAGTILGHLTHQGYGEGVEPVSEVLAASLPGRSHTVRLAVVATASPRQGTHDHALLVENVEVPPLHRLDMVMAGNRCSGSGAFLRPQRSRFLDLQYGGRRTCLKPRLNHTPGFARPQQLSKCVLGCHRPASSCGRQAPRFHCKLRGTKSWRPRNDSDGLLRLISSQRQNR